MHDSFDYLKEILYGRILINESFCAFVSKLAKSHVVHFGCWYLLCQFNWILLHTWCLMFVEKCCILFPGPMHSIITVDLDDFFRRKPLALEVTFRRWYNGSDGMVDFIFADYVAPMSWFHNYCLSFVHLSLLLQLDLLIGLESLSIRCHADGS